MALSRLPRARTFALPRRPSNPGHLVIRILPRTLARRLAALTLALAAFSSPVYASSAEITHVVAQGQTLGRIAKRYHTSVETLREVNDLKRGQRIRPGLVLVIPEKGKEKEAIQRAAALRARGEKPRKDKDKDKDKGKADKAAKNAKTQPEEKFARKPKRAGFVRMARGTERFEAQVLTRRGRLVPAALAGITRMLRYAPTDTKLAIDPRLATLIGMVSDHFGGRALQVVSGFRPYVATQHTRHSNHNVGRAIDFSVEGVPNTVVRDYCRTFRNAGVGYYPNSTFVHLDVRQTKVYWIDYSSPGEPPRYDSPSAQASADEATRDVESGSAGTQAGSPQGTDSMTGNQETEDSHPSKSVEPGNAGPPPSATPEPTGKK
jgi:uncharacterized protein YcbK (DUF882 family)